MKRFAAMLSMLAALTVAQGPAQTDRHDRAIYVVPRNEFMDSVRAEAARFKTKEQPVKKALRVDFSGIDHPASPSEFTSAWHNKPVAQAISGMCWCFSTTSFFESEIYRQTKRQIKLSELFTVYWEYVEKARRFVQERGNSAFGQGSESNAVSRIWRTYGIVPAEAYTGLQPGQKFHDHDQLFSEMNAYLQSLKTTNAWNEDIAISTIRSILNRYLGEPPATVTVDGKEMTPLEYFHTVVRLNLDDYVEFLSLAEKPYHTMAEYEVPDNWWHSKDYYNIPLDEFMTAVKRAVRDGYTLAIGGDVSEPGIEGHEGIAIVPSFDIPSSAIDENARQFRFSNGTTGDDHGIHLVGYVQRNGQDWYLIKDSGSGSRNNNHPGYYFYSEDFVKLKMLTAMVHRDAVKDFLKLTKD